MLALISVTQDAPGCSANPGRATKMMNDGYRVSQVIHGLRIAQSNAMKYLPEAAGYPLG